MKKKTLKNTFESSNLIYLLRINTHFAQKKKKAHNKVKQFFFLAKKNVRGLHPMIASARRRQRRRPRRQRRAALHSSLCASAGVANRSGRCAATSWSCSDTSQPGEVASVYQASYTSVAFPPPPLGRNEETATDALRQLKIRPPHFYCRQNANAHMDTCTRLPDCNRWRQMLQNGNGGKRRPSENIKQNHL